MTKTRMARMWSACAVVGIAAVGGSTGLARPAAADTVSVVDGTMHVYGDIANDRIWISQSKITSRYLIWARDGDVIDTHADCGRVRVGGTERPPNIAYCHRVVRVQVHAEDGSDEVVFSPNVRGSAKIYGGPGDDSNGYGLRGTRNDDLIEGGPGDDRIDGRAGGDRLFGEDTSGDSTGAAGIDYIEGGAGADLFDGGPGAGDTASYLDHPTDDPIEVTLGNGAADDGSEGDRSPHKVGTRDEVGTGIENVIGGPEADNEIYGDNNGNVLVGGEWRDLLEGRGGSDVLVGLGSYPQLDILLGGDRLNGDWSKGSPLALSSLAGSDTLFGDSGYGLETSSPGRDNMFGGPGNDTMYGGTPPSTIDELDDFLEGGDGNDTIYGEGGKDEILAAESDPDARRRDTVNCGLDIDILTYDQLDTHADCELRTLKP